jgi:uncharacterized protein YjaG (DUF416 family)
MKSFSQFKVEHNAKAFLSLAEREMSQSQMKRREEIAQAMDDEDFKERYGKDWKSVKMATATKQAMGEESDSEEEFEEVYNEHWCAKHVYHDVFGEGVVVDGEHAFPDDNGEIEWYTVEFPHGKETVFTEDVKVMHERMHGQMLKKKKKMSEEEVSEMSSKEKMKRGLYNKEEKVQETVKHPNQQQLDVHEPEKDELTAKDFEMLRKIKKARAK